MVPLSVALTWLGLKFHSVTLLMKQKVKTRVVNDSRDPEWDEELTLTIKDVNTPIHLVSSVLI